MIILAMHINGLRVLTECYKGLSYYERIGDPTLSLTHRGRVTHIRVGNLTIIVSDNGLSPGRRQAIIWTNARMLLIEPLVTIFSEILIAIQTFLFQKMHLKMSSVKWRPFFLGINVFRLDNALMFTWTYNLLVIPTSLIWRCFSLSISVWLYLTETIHIMSYQNLNTR